MSDVINVSMFGGKGLFGGREAKKEAVISSCQFANSCPAFQAGRCAAANPRLYECVNLETRTVQGYTSKAKKHGQFVREWSDHEKYGAIKEKMKRFEYIGDNKIQIRLPHIAVDVAMHGAKGYSAMNVKRVYYVNRDTFTLENLKNIMNSYSVPMMGGKLDNKEEKEEMLLAIKEIDENLYNDYIKSTGHEIDYLKKEAYLTTLKPGIELSDGWYWDGEYLNKTEKTSVDCRAIKGFVYATEVRFKPEEDSYVEIKDNSWVTKDTKFKG